MLDLDSLAERRAKSLNQQEDKWREALWSPAFQKISASMSDGEVETLLTSCPSVAHMQAVIQFLERSLTTTERFPYTVLLQEAQSAGLGLSDWIKTLPGLRA
jgi:hypothetical protein